MLKHFWRLLLSLCVKNQEGESSKPLSPLILKIVTRREWDKPRSMCFCRHEKSNLTGLVKRGCA